MAEQTKKTRIAILGAGVGGMTTAFALTRAPKWQDTCEITVYQRGWRLGGKGASGRNAARYQRIEEHGLHIWFGFYERAFCMMRECFRDLDRPPGAPLATFEDAFHKHSAITFMEPTAKGYVRQVMDFPTDNQLPGNGEPPSLLSLIQKGLYWLAELAEQLAQAVPSLDVPRPEPIGGNGLPGTDADGRSAPHRWLKLAAQFLERHPRPPQGPLGGVLDAAAHAVLLKIVKGFRDEMRKAVGDPANLIDEVRWLVTLLDFGATLTIGMFEDQVFTGGDEGFDKLDVEEFRAWLKRHDGLPFVINSVLVKGFYDAAFCYRDGRTDQPDIGAGTILRTILLMGAAYKGAFMWKMQGGMGDVIFAPLYELLARRGVKFQFFHDVQALHLTPDKKQIGEIVIGRQATVKGGGEYRPLESIKDMPSWPNQPFYEQLVEGDQIKAGPPPHTFPYDLESCFSSWKPVETKTLKLGQDFDAVVLAIPSSALEPITRELSAASTPWKQMVDGLASCRTQGVQLWLRGPAPSVGWPLHPRAVMDGYKDPLNSWADMSQVLRREDWPAEGGAQTVAYFVGPMPDDPKQPAGPDDAYPHQQDDLVRDGSRRWFQESLPALWPPTAQLGALGPDWGILASPGQTLQGDTLYDAQFFRANVDLSERYVLAVTNTLRYRLPPGQPGFDNLVIAGDWTKNGLNFGCVESAARGGLQAGETLLARLGLYAPPFVYSDEPQPVVPGPSYVVPATPLVFGPPYQLADVLVRSMLIDADQDAMQRAVDEQLAPAAPRGMQFKVLGPWAFLQIGWIGSNTSGVSPDAGYGQGSETSITALIPVALEGHGKVGDVGFFGPVILVDNAFSLATGREIYGFAKSLGHFTMTPDGAEAPDSLVVETQAFKQYAPSAVLQRQPLFQVKKSQKQPGKVWSFLEGAVTAIKDAFAGKVQGFLLFEQMAAGKVHFFNVIQLRNTTAPQKATYQQVTRCAMKVPLPKGFGILPHYDVTIEALDSHPIVKILGLKSGTFTAHTGMWVRYDTAQLVTEDFP